MGERFSVGIVVRSYEVDSNGHVNHANYHRYGEHARSAHLAAAGCGLQRLVDAGLGLVMLQTSVKFLRELREGDHVEIDSRLEFGEGKSFGMAHTIVRGDGAVAAEITCRMGLIDSAARRLVADPRERLRELATDPAVLGL
jgi:acyl-CoA thioester hydrolase